MDNQNDFNEQMNKPKMSGGMVFAVALVVVLVAAIVVTSALVFLKKDNRGNDNTQTPPPQTTKEPELIKREDPAVMTINGTPITKSEYTYMLFNTANTMLNKLEIPEEATDEEINKIYKDYINGTEDGKTFWERVDAQAQEAARVYAAMKEKAEQEKVELTEEQRVSLEAYFDQYFMFSVDSDKPDQFYLDTFGITKTEFINYYCNMERFNTMKYNIAEKAEYPDDVLKPVYDENIEIFKVWSVRHILILTVDPNSTEDPIPTLSPDKKAEKLALAEEILKKVRSGADMEKLVEEYSEDNPEAIKENKGVYDVSEESSFVPEFKDWALNSKVGDTGIVETEYGYHVMRCEKDSSFESRKENVKILHAMNEFEKSISDLAKTDKYKPEIIEDVRKSIDMSFMTKNFE